MRLAKGFGSIEGGSHAGSLPALNLNRRRRIAPHRLGEIGLEGGLGRM